MPDFHAASFNFGALFEPLQGFDERRETIDAAAFGIQVDKLRGLAGIFTDAL